MFGVLLLRLGDQGTPHTRGPHHDNPRRETRQAMTESEALAALFDPELWNGPYRPKCDECEYGDSGGAYLLGPVALKAALEHTKATGHKVVIYQGEAAE